MATHKKTGHLFSSKRNMKHLKDAAATSNRAELYNVPWVKKALEETKRSEINRWAMFSDDGLIHKTRSDITCADLKNANPRVREYPPAIKHIPIFKGSKKGAPRILCWVFSTAALHMTRAEAVRTTWGKRCDGLLFFSNMADPTMNAVLLTERSKDSNDNLVCGLPCVWCLVSLFARHP